jgi:hypothetical protein
MRSMRRKRGRFSLKHVYSSKPTYLFDRRRVINRLSALVVAGYIIAPRAVIGLRRSGGAHLHFNGNEPATNSARLL